MNNKADFGPQYAKDAGFQKRMRFHQSWYRAMVLKTPYGYGPGRASKNEYGNMLTLEAACLGLNFLTPAIFEEVKERLQDPTGLVDSYRLLHNMLSSQPMCFNLFGPLKRDPELAAQLFRIWCPDLARVTGICFEYAPGPAGNYLDDRTAFDAFIEYERSNGGRGFIGIETKLSEPFSPNRYYGSPEDPQSHKYQRWMKKPASPWLDNAWPEVAAQRHNQLWRDHLLAIAMLQKEELGYAGGKFMLIYHPDDKRCAAVVTAYKELLKPADETFLAVSLKDVMDKLEPLVVSTDAHLWVSRFRQRYLDLEASEKDWNMKIRSRAEKSAR